MGKPHPIELRERVVGFVEEGNTHRSTAARFLVSVKFVNEMVRLKQKTGRLTPKRQGNPGRGKLARVGNWVRVQIEERGELTLDEMVALLREAHGIKVHRSSIGRLFHRLGLTHKKRPASS